MSTDKPLIAIAIAAITGLASLFINQLLEYKNDKVEERAIISAIQTDITSTADILQDVNIIDHFILAYKQPEKYKNYTWADEPRKENYFAIFDAVASKIGKMPGDLPEKIVIFYKYSKLARDTAQSFSRKS